MNILKRILAVAAGVGIGLAFVMIGDYGASLIYAFPSNIDPANKQMITEVMSHVPLSAFLVMLAGYVAGAFLGGMVGTLIAGREMSRPAIIIGIILTMGNIWNQMEIPHPMWFSIVSTLVYIPFAWLGYSALKPKY